MAVEARSRAGVGKRKRRPRSTGSIVANLGGRWHAIRERYEWWQLTLFAKIYEYQPTFLHAKFGVIDGRWSIIGSPNLNNRSRQLDEENAFGILDTGLGSTLHRVFFNDLTHSQQINLDEWRKRNPLARLFQTACRMLDDQS